jgi:Holliday junction resolvasome RuvABC endonuclease subunit
MHERRIDVAKELSELLAELSTQAKNVEDDFAAIAEETDAKAAERRDRTRAAATAAVDSLEQGVSSVEDAVAGHWRALQDRVNSEVTDIQSGIAERQQERAVDHAERQAAAADERAARSVAFAVAAVQTAGLAVLDSAVARREAESVKRQ